ncbi:uncharacterized protein C8Q71DRAFT_732737 [Rhodofomes roseus]|uniref:Uncharacterized protein n=1 Tax=Rhodofomes roseus TaxID=34475 RepID=A0ABQ8KTJ8_9APHY|nr:uncharacterized protein C8Q71DRAFT_732737 [Rhodofomes roseus]KAH9842405.1 hypothetical protein C8Q71DRAFT_732737 [Rhodofomes roseus]
MITSRSRLYGSATHLLTASPDGPGTTIPRRRTSAPPTWTTSLTMCSPIRLGNARSKPESSAVPNSRRSFATFTCKTNVPGRSARLSWKASTAARGTRMSKTRLSRASLNVSTQRNHAGGEPSEPDLATHRLMEQFVEHLDGTVWLETASGETELSLDETQANMAYRDKLVQPVLSEFASLQQMLFDSCRNAEDLKLKPFGDSEYYAARVELIKKCWDAVEEVM